MSFGLYALDDATRNLLKAENFIDPEFSARNFVEQLGANQEDGTDAAERDSLDPKPYIRAFEAVLGQLQNLQTRAKQAEKDALEQVKSAEFSHSQNIISLGRSIDAVSSDFTVLDGMISDIASSTSSLSDRLERLSGQLEQAQSCSFLVTCYTSFCQRGHCPELVKMWENGGSEARRKCANTVGHLQQLARKVGYSDASQEEIDKFAERIEVDLLEQFNDAYRAADLTVMRESADLAYDFNGGDRVVQIFVNQHEFFIMQDKLVSLSSLDSGDREYWKPLSDPAGDYQEFDAQIQAFVDEIRDYAVTETDIIRKVFRKPLDVVRVFLLRTFDQRIQQQMESLLQSAENVSTLAYLRVLHICYGKIGGLIKALKDGANQAEIDNDGVLAGLLDQNYTDMFAPYAENDRYFELEKRNLQEVTDELVLSFSNNGSKRLAKEQSLLGRFMDSNSKEANVGEGQNEEKEGSKGRIGQLMKAVRLERTNSAKNAASHNSMPPESPANTPTTPVSDSNEFEKSDLSADNVQKLLRAYVEAVRRNLDIASGQESKNNTQLLLRQLMDGVVKRYIEAALDEAIIIAGSAQDFSFSGLRVVSQACISTQLVAVFVKKVLLPIMSGSEPPSKETVEHMNIMTERVEDKCNAVLKSTVDSTLTRVNQALLKQKKKDFQSQADDVGFLQYSNSTAGTSTDTITAVCREIKTILQSMQQSAIQNLDGGNVEQFFYEIGFGFKAALLKHIKKFTYTPAGGKILSHDLQSYQEVIDEWSISELSSSFTVIHGIANLYTAESQVLPSLLRGSNLSQLKPFVIREYLSKRQDYSSTISKIPISELFPRTSRRAVVPIQGHETKPFLYSYQVAF